MASMLDGRQQLSPEPISPAREEDVAGSRVWQDEEDISSAKRKGKRREDSPEIRGSEDTYGDVEGDTPAYPPVNEDQAETRRVEEVCVCLIS
jgi:hypothetical protein